LLKNKRKRKNLILSLLLIAVLLITGAVAFMTATDSADNVFTVGNVKIDLTEPDWKPDYDSDGDGINDALSSIISNQIVPKNPTITNTGLNNAYVYIMVEVPKAYSLEYVNKNNVTVTENHKPLFTFDVNEGWTLIDKQVASPENYYEEEAYDYYLFAFDETLLPGNSATLFDEVVFQNVTSSFTNSDNSDVILNVKVTGYAIQSDFYGNEATDAASAWTLYSNQNEWQWPSQRYSDLATVEYVDDNGILLYSETVHKNEPIELYYDTALARDGYFFDWTIEETGEDVYDGIKVSDDTTFVATYTNTGFGSTPSNYIGYMIHQKEDGSYYAGVIDLHSGSSSFPTKASTLIIPSTISFKMPNISSAAGPLVAFQFAGGYVGVDKGYNLTTGETYTFPVEAIETEAFAVYPETIKTLVIPDSVKIIEENAVAGSNTLTSVYMSYGVKELEPAAFGCNPLLKKVQLPSSLKTIGTGAFGDCYSLSDISIPESVTYMDEAVFDCCENLENITIPENITEIKKETFNGCYNLKSVDLHDNITSIGDSAFSDCDKLTTVSIGENVSHIGKYAFRNCGSLTSFVVDENNKYYTSDNTGVLFDNYMTTLIQYPIGNTTTNYNVPNGVKTIDDYAFYNAKNLTSVLIPNTVTTIGENAFRNCTNLSDVEFTSGNKLINLGASAFHNCSSLTDIAIPRGVNTINTSTFYDCKSMNSITIPNTVTSIKFGAFKNCNSLTDVTFFGTGAEWSAVSIASNNTSLTNANLICNSN